MHLIQKIFSTLQTWVFKRKLLRFSGRFPWKAESCFYCPEMCLYACPVVESTASNTYSPRGKMSLAHLQAINKLPELSPEAHLHVLDQCTQCGRCTENCVYEIDVFSELRQQRSHLRTEASLPMRQIKSSLVRVSTHNSTNSQFHESNCDTIIITNSQNHDSWTNGNYNKSLAAAGYNMIDVVTLFDAKDLFEEGRITHTSLKGNELITLLGKYKAILCEEPRDAYMLHSLAPSSIQKRIRTVWQQLFDQFVNMDWPQPTLFQESSFLTRNLPRLGFSIPMYERQYLPLYHFGVRALDAGGESSHVKKYPKQAQTIANNLIRTFYLSRPDLRQLITQSYDAHVLLLQAKTINNHEQLTVMYWLDALI